MLSAAGVRDAAPAPAVAAAPAGSTSGRSLRRVPMGIAMGLTAAAHHLFAAGAAVRRAHEPGGHADVLPARQDRPGTTPPPTWWRSSPAASPASCVATLLSRGLPAHPSVNYVATVPGPRRTLVAFAAEVAISFVLMPLVLRVSNSPGFARYTGAAAGALVALYITVEAPLSGMSMNPARTLGPALLSAHGRHALDLLHRAAARHARSRRSSIVRSAGARACAAPSSITRARARASSAAAIRTIPA